MQLMSKVKSKIKYNEKLSVDAVYGTRVYPGYTVYNKIMADKGEKAQMFLCPYIGTGDVYLASLYIRAYADENFITNYVVVVIGGANYKVASLFGFEHIEKVSQEEADTLVRLAMFLGSENKYITILHHRPPQMYCGILENMRNYNGLDFVDLFLYNVFHLERKEKDMPEFDYTSPAIDQLFALHGLVEGRTVILAPYVNTLPSLPWWVWVNIAEKLKRKGYVVCTNCGSPAEGPINGTIPLNFGFDISVPMLEKCGNFISIRSGFCDIVSSAKCKKVIVYQPYLFWGDGTNFDYFSLNKIGFCDDAIELEYEGVEFLDLIDRIIEQF